MLNSIRAVALIGLLLTGTATVLEAATDQETCLAAVEAVRLIGENSDEGERELAMVDILIEVSTGLCERDLFELADDLLSVARTILGVEETPIPGDSQQGKT